MVMMPERVAAPRTDAMTTLAALLEARTGQQIAVNRLWRIETALKPLLRMRGLASLDDLVAMLATDHSGRLGDAVSDALLNQESSFFRDAPSLELTVAAVEKLQRAGMSRRPRIWSAACSTGQEPLSLAILFADHAARTGLPEPEIVATDVSEAALVRARVGRYSQFEIQRGLPVRQMIAWFEAVDSDWVVKPDLVNKISFRRHNLVGDTAPAGRFDIVLCRNVLIYLSQPLRQRVFDMIAGVLRPGGYLVLGAGETTIGDTDRFLPSTEFRGLYQPTAQPGGFDVTI